MKTFKQYMENVFADQEKARSDQEKVRRKEEEKEDREEMKKEITQDVLKQVQRKTGGKAGLQ